ncbi:amino acid ABC transporter permease [Streptomyces sp. NBC_01176]|uniref:amino acid ABC transporter permease n=1 Tax=Streptomyces sp. NBC_01176 TaxID=2903760 RepID=UPI00386D9862|nr:amino acid ABC transporter permease [Streptomyces sp. NBC_01176]
MAWDEWEQLKSAAAKRHTTQMQLNQLSADPGGSSVSGHGAGGAGTLKHSSGPWTRAAGTAGDLRTSTGMSKADLGSAHDGIASATEGLASLGPLKSVVASWQRRLGSVRDECDSLEPALRQVAKDMGEVDVKVATQADSVKVATTGKSE